MMATGLPKPICVVTHHKTGTRWLRTVFKKIGRELGLPLPHMRDLNEIGQREFLTGTPGIISITNGEVPGFLQNVDHVTILHMIRDPRDVLISGARYHLRHQPAKRSPEKFLHRPRPELDGKSYQQKLQSLPNYEAQLMFEMRWKHLHTMQQLRAWDYSDPRCIEWRYEDLIADEQTDLFADALAQAGYHGDALSRMRRIFWENSLFGGLADPSSRVAHIDSGIVLRWRRELPLTVAESYLSFHGDDLIALGYEPDKRWLDHLVPSKPPVQSTR